MANKLELTWYGKDEPIRVEPRLLIENTALSNTAADPDTQNMLIHGDNLLALKALESKFAGQVKCIYIDPPYNTGSAFEHYDDNLEHSEWLNLMLPRLKLLRELLSDDGSIWISIDKEASALPFPVVCGTYPYPGSGLPPYIAYSGVLLNPGAYNEMPDPSTV